MKKYNVVGYNLIQMPGCTYLVLSMLVWACLGLTMPSGACLGLSVHDWKYLGLSRLVWVYMCMTGNVWACQGLSGSELIYSLIPIGSWTDIHTYIKTDMSSL